MENVITPVDLVDTFLVHVIGHYADFANLPFGFFSLLHSSLKMCLLLIENTFQKRKNKTRVVECASMFFQMCFL